MTTPVLTSVLPTSGPTSGGDLVRLAGVGFAARVMVRLGGLAATLVSVHDEGGVSIADVRTPSHEEGVVDVELVNLDADGSPLPGESVVLPGAYRFHRPRIAEESDLTRLIRQLLRELEKQVLATVSMAVSVDYDDTPADGQNVVAMASLPSLVLTGPTLRENRFYAANVAHEDQVATPSGPEFVRRRPPYTVDLLFTITAASERTVELFNLMAAVATFLNRNRWITMLRDPADASLGTVRWEMDAEGEWRTQLGGKDDVRAFSCGLVLRGFDVDEGFPADLGRADASADLEVNPMKGTS